MLAAKAHSEFGSMRFALGQEPASVWSGDELGVLTTSQNLAHRIAREGAKAFGGKPRFTWDDEDGSRLARIGLSTIRNKA